MTRRLVCAALALAVVLCAGCADLPAPGFVGATARDGTHPRDLVIVAVHDRPEPRALPGATPRADYRRAQGYAGSDSARAQASELARDHALREVAAWTIGALQLRCVLYRIEAGADRSAVLARLGSDPRAQLAQPLNDFETLSSEGGPYNDPYLKLQQGFATIQAGPAQRWSRGENIRVAVIDTAIDADHPDLGGRVTSQRNFVGGGAAGAADAATVRGEAHGTQVAGIIAAAANNGLGIVGVAPLAQVLSYRACWNLGAATGARCNSYTLAQALGAAIDAGAEVINLSLGGPRDPLLERLTTYAIARGAVVVGAVAPGGRSDGFPAAVPGVLMVAAAEDGAAAGGHALSAPGRQILTLMPGGSYDFASGSSMAAAHVSGAVALLLTIDGNLRAAALRQLLGPGGVDEQAVINICRAAQRLRPAGGCGPMGGR